MKRGGDEAYSLGGGKGGGGVGSRPHLAASALRVKGGGDAYLLGGWASEVVATHQRVASK